MKNKTIIEKYENMTYEQLQEEEKNIKQLLHEQLDMVLSGLGDSKGYKDEPKLTVKKDMKNNVLIYQTLTNVLRGKRKPGSNKFVWEEGDIQLISKEEFEQQVKEGRAVKYNSSKKKKENK